MSRILAPLVLLAGLLLSGCARSADPLDWKVEGRHISDLQQSFADLIAKLPPELSQEFVFCVGNIKADTLANLSGTATEREDRICRRLRGKSVREVLIEGYELAQHTGEAHLAYQSELLIRLLKRDDRPADVRGQPLAERIEVTKKIIESLKQKQAKAERRLAELRATVAK